MRQITSYAGQEKVLDQSGNNFKILQDRELNNYKMREWMDALSRMDAVPEKVVSDFEEDDTHKVERLHQLHQRIALPIEQHFLIEGSKFNLMTPELKSYFQSRQGSLFAVRATPVCTGLRISVRRDLTQKQCFEFVNNLWGGPSAYRITLRDLLNAEFSGTIIIAQAGLYAELGHGPHILLNQGVLRGSEIVTARLIFPNHHIVYSAADPRLRAVLWGAVKYLIQDKEQEISPLSMPVFEKGYFEFEYNEVEGYRFLDFSDKPFFARPPFPVTTPHILP